MLAPDSDVTADSRIDVRLDASTTEELLVNWLREILFHNQTRGFVTLDVEITELTGTRLAARLVGGVPMSGLAAQLEIKGVTYHGLVVEKTDEGYLARIVLDI